MQGPELSGAEIRAKRDDGEDEGAEGFPYSPDSRRRRGRLARPGGAAGSRHQPRRRLARQVEGPCPRLLKLDALRARLLYRLHKPPRKARGHRPGHEPSPAGEAGGASPQRQGSLRHLPRADAGQAGRRERPGGRRQGPRRRHRGEPGGEVDLPEERRPGPAHDAVRHVRPRRKI